jgi:hypothetical protein
MGSSLVLKKVLGYIICYSSVNGYPAVAYGGEYVAEVVGKLVAALAL